MATLTRIPKEIFIRRSGRGGNNGPLPKFVKNYLIFSFCFGIYGFTRGYRGNESTIKYLSEQNYLYEFAKYLENKFEKNQNKNQNQLIMIDQYKKDFNKYYKNKIDNKISKISIKDKIANGIIEVYPFYLPILNIKQIYCLLKRIEIYFLRYNNRYSNKQYYTNSLLAEVCYETI